MSKKLKLENGNEIDNIGFETWPMETEKCFEAVCSAGRLNKA